MTDRVTVLTRLLIGACTIDDAARDLRIPADAVPELLRAVAAETADVMPAGLNLETRRVEFADLQGANFREPFLSETLQKAWEQDAETLNFEVNFESFLQAGATLTDDPRGFIFHVGRCGSTLLANSLQAAADWLVLKEPDILNDVLAAWLTAPNAAAREEAERLTGAALRFFARTRAARAGLIVKTAAWNVRLARVLSKLAPGARGVFLFRSPEETVASLMDSRPGWFELIHRHRHIQALFYPTLAAVDPETRVPAPVLFAHAWLSAAEAALEMDPEQLLIIDYAALRADGTSVTDAVLRHFGMELDAAALARVAHVGTVYSKDAGRSERFDPSGKHARPPMAPQEVDTVRTITGGAYDQLRKRSSLAGASWQPS